MHHDTVSRLAEERIERPEDLIEFASASVKTIIGSVRQPGDRVPDGVNEGRAMSTQSLKFGANAVLCLESVTGIIKHCETLGFQATADALACKPATKNFQLECDALVQRKSLTVSTPRVPSNSDAVKQTDALLCILSKLVRKRSITLNHTARSEIEVKNDVLLLMLAGQ